MLSDEMAKLQLDLKLADPNNDRLFYELIGRSITILGLPTNDIAKALSTSVETVESWRAGNTVANFAIRPWIYQYFIKQITLHNQHTTFHISNDYGYKYNFSKVDVDGLYKLLLKLSVCSHLIDKLQVSFNPPKLQLAFFINSLKGGSFDCIEKLHQLINEMGGKPEISSEPHSAVVIPFSKKEKETVSSSRPIFRHCLEVKDGCFIGEGGKCICSCCLLEKVETAPKQFKLEATS